LFTIENDLKGLCRTMVAPGFFAPAYLPRLRWAKRFGEVR